MDYRIQKQILLLVVSFFTISVSPAYGYNVFVYSVDKPELNINMIETPVLHQVKATALLHVANQIQARPACDLAEFAKVSLSEMAYLFEEEAIRARHERPASREKSQKLVRWSHSTLEYANHLQAIAGSIDVNTPVELHVGSDGEILFVINGMPFLVSSPLIYDHGKLEQRIINAFCRNRVCDLEFPELRREPPKRNVVIEAGWRMDDQSQPEYVTSDGLHFIFGNIKNRTRKEEACLNIIKEMKLMADVLKETHDKGIFIDWNYLDIKPDTDGSHHRLIINAFGDAIIFSLSELAKRPDLTGLALAWIKAQVENTPYQQYLYADEILAGEIH